MDENRSQMDQPKVITPSAAHRKQMVWQVWVPLGASILIVLALMVLTILGAFRQSGQIERWGNLSAVWVILPVLMVIFVFTAITFACVYGMSKLLGKIPGWMLSLQLFMLRVALETRKFADAATQPVVKANTTQTRVKTLWKKVFGD
jgi:hypothetical protein